MIVPLLLFLMACVVAATALFLPDQQDLVLLAIPAALAALVLLIAARLRAPRRTSVPEPRHASDRRQYVIVDGSNVMHWKNEVPSLDTLREVLGDLTARGLTPGVVFDANAGYLLVNRYLHHQDFAGLLGLPVERVMVVARGAPADPTILTAARNMKARVVSNDQFRDWADNHPEVHEPGHVIRGRYRGDRLVLDLGENPA